MTKAWQLEITSTQKLVYLAMCDCANDQGECYPSIAGLNKKTSLAERSTQKAITELEAMGFLSREFRTGRSTVYWITPDKGRVADQKAAKTPAPDAPRIKCTPAPDAPTPAPDAPTPAFGAPPPPHDVHPTPAFGAPRNVIEPSIEPSRKRQGTVRSKKPKSIIAPDWQPSDRCKTLLAEAGIAHGFYMALVGEFVLYWEERHEARAGWDATFLNHAMMQWQRQGGARASPTPAIHVSKADALRDRNKRNLEQFKQQVLENEHAID
jgi:hypothetical protein